MVAEPRESWTLSRFPTPIGELLLVIGPEGALRAVDWSDYEGRMRRLLQRYYGEPPLRDGAAPAGVGEAFRAYFEGEVAALSRVAWRIAGTPFQQKVWTALCEIPAGATVSYATLARRIGAPTAVRAVGLANGANPIGLVLPCHRVIGANGSLTGYGGGLERKRWLLQHEGVRLREGARGPLEAVT